MATSSRQSTRSSGPWGGISLALIASSLAGCATTHPMMPTPTMYTGAQAKPLFTAVPAERRTPPLDILFITDRARASAPDEKLPYTADRSREVAFGSQTIEFGEGLDWDALVKASTAAERAAPLELTLGATKEHGRFPRTPYEVVPTPAGLTRAPAVIDAHEKATQALQAEVARRLAASPRKELVLYVHGYHNTYEDAALTMGELCHYLGRELACGIFTWPAGGTRGILLGYNVDYESSVFAVEHLRKAIRTIAGTPGLERLHLLAHSRGTELLATALSELSIEAYVLEGTLTSRFKINNIVLMSPDIDADVAPSKIFKILSDPDIPYGKTANPRLALKPSPDFKLTVYVSPDDKALAASSILMGSIMRLGRIQAETLPPHVIDQIRKLGLFDVIQFRGKADSFGHSYFVSNPHVSSDIVALLRYRLRPNEPGRPLDEIQRPFWRVRTEGGK